MKAVFSDRAYTAVLAETTEKISTETGGLFLGALREDTWYIVESIDPGPNSIFQVAYFEYDRPYTQHLINKTANLYDQKLDLIGLWHRHPGSLDRFSSTDNGTNAKYAAMRDDGAISALVNVDPDFRITMYHVGQPCLYSRIPYEVGDNLIPEELMRFKTPERFFRIMEGLLGGGAAGYHRTISLASFMDFILPSLETERITDGEEDQFSGGLEELIDALAEDLTFMADRAGIETAVALEGEGLTVCQDSADRPARLSFRYSQTRQSALLTYEGARYLYRPGLFAAAFERERSRRGRGPGAAARQNSVLGSVFRKLRSSRNEE